MPPPAPIYTVANCTAAYQLNWSLAVFWHAPMPDPERWLAVLRTVTEPDGVRILEHHSRSPTTSQFFVSTTPAVAPQALLHSVKGRLQYLVRKEFPKPFRRNYSLHSIGAAKRTVLEEYLAAQISHHPMADPRAGAILQGFQIDFPDIDLTVARRSAHGEFRYHLHLVFVNAGRWREICEEALGRMRDMIVKASAHKGHRLRKGQILADHIHLLLGCDLGAAPQDVALGYLNNLAFALGMRPVFQFGYYVGTFGEYDRGAIWRSLS
jgi:REP element-mobilizing transposase RayT